MADELAQGGMSDEEFKAAVDELSADESEPAKKPRRKSGGLEAELEELEARRAELKRTPADQLGGEFARVKARIAEIKAELGHD